MSIRRILDFFCPLGRYSCGIWFSTKWHLPCTASSKSHCITTSLWQLPSFTPWIKVQFFYCSLLVSLQFSPRAKLNFDKARLEINVTFNFLQNDTLHAQLAQKETAQQLVCDSYPPSLSEHKCSFVMLFFVIFTIFSQSKAPAMHIKLKKSPYNS